MTKKRGVNGTTTQTTQGSASGESVSKGKVICPCGTEYPAEDDDTHFPGLCNKCAYEAQNKAPSDEIRGLRILICIPSHGDCKSAFLHSVVRAAIHFTSLPYEGLKECDVTIVKSSLLPEGRARLVARAYDYNASHILFCDTDMKFPPDTIVRLLNHNVAVVGVNYPRKNIEARPTAYLDSPDYVGPVWTGQKSEGLQEVSIIGLGCVLIDMRVFDKLDLPFFAIQPQPPENVKHMGEDVFFCKKLHEAGIPVHIDHDLSKEVGHIGEFEYTNFLSKEAEIVKQALYKDL